MRWSLCRDMTARKVSPTALILHAASGVIFHLSIFILSVSFHAAAENLSSYYYRRTQGSEVKVQDAPDAAGSRPVMWAHISWWRDEELPARERCLGLASNVPGTEVVLQQCVWPWGRPDGDVQLWSLPTSGKDLRIGSSASEAVPLCLDTRNGQLTVGTPIVINRCSSTSRSQRWFVNRFSLITALESNGLCMDLAPGSLPQGRQVPAVGTKLVLARCVDPTVVNPRNTSQWFPETSKLNH
jgi:hypothetical protein